MALNTTWTQFQGSAAGAGYTAVRPAPAVAPSRSAGIDSPAGSSPIVDPVDGSIYVAGNGVLQSFRPDLTSQWRSHVQPRASGTTPAQDDAGRIYVIFGNQLVCFSRTGVVQWKYEPPPQIAPGTTGPEHPAFLFGTPKVWSRGNSTLVFVIFSYFDFPRSGGSRTNYLLAPDERGIPVGLLLFCQTPFIEVSGGGGTRLAASPILTPAGVTVTRAASPILPATELGATFHTATGPAAGHGGPLVHGEVVFSAELKRLSLGPNAHPPQPAPCIFQDAQGPDQPIIVVSDGNPSSARSAGRTGSDSLRSGADFTGRS
jgi:hypothetical protein